MKIKKIINICLLCLWMIIVFLLSNQNASVSSNTSEIFIVKVFDLLGIDINSDIIENLQFIFRKSAHFTLYFLGGILSCNLFEKNIFISFIFIVISAILDEFHQFFIPGRSMQLFDICIDSIGGITGIYFCYILLKLYNNLIYKKSINKKN